MKVCLPSSQIEALLDVYRIIAGRQSLGRRTLQLLDTVLECLCVLFFTGVSDWSQAVLHGKADGGWSGRGHRRRQDGAS